MIADKNKELESYPRQNKNCIEYFTKYSEKHQDYMSKFEQYLKTETMIAELLEKHKIKKNKLFVDNFMILRKNFKEIFREIVKDGRAELWLVKKATQKSQDTDMQLNSSMS